MKVETMAIGMEVRHPDYGTGKVVALSENDADIQFGDGLKSVNPQFTELHPLKATAELSGLEIPLEELIDRIARAAVDRSMAQTMETSTQELGAKWHGGHMELIPGKSELQSKEVPLEVFFHKIVGIRNQLRVLEQKINSHAVLTDADKVELQQYISRCYGSLTSFNVLFKDKESQFSSK